MDVAVEHGGSRMFLEDRDRFLAVAGVPVPALGEREQRAVCEHEQSRLRWHFGNLAIEPGELLVAESALRIRRVVDADEVDAAMLECPMSRTEGLLERGATIE